VSLDVGTFIEILLVIFLLTSFGGLKYSSDASDERKRFSESSLSAARFSLPRVLTHCRGFGLPGRRLRALLSSRIPVAGEPIPVTSACSRVPDRLCGWIR